MEPPPLDPAAERHQSGPAPHLDRSPVPAWYPPAAGSTAAALLAAVLFGRHHAVLAVLGALAALCCGAVLFTAYRRQRGARPAWRTASKELREALRTYLLGLGVAVCVVIAAARSLPAAVATVLVFVVVTVAAALFERLSRKTEPVPGAPGG